ncbi:TPA: hypothetical protein EYP26_04780 [Candidatus Bathyarchaeota archaeon]|nr:hypothetical protein [Candidatus Bathyarchaeota archaeon]
MFSTISLPTVAIQELEKRAKEIGVSIYEYLLSLLLSGIDPNVGAEKYIEGALKLIEQAREGLREDDIRQASERVWGACALSLKAHALFKEGKSGVPR